MNHLFCEVPQSLLQQSTPTTICCHPRASLWGGVLWLASLPLFPPNITMVIIAKQFYLFHQTRGHFSKKYDLCPCAVANGSLAFLWRFRSSCFFLAEWPFRLWTRFTVDEDTFVPVSSSIFTRSFGVVLGLICTFRTKVH